MTYPVKFTQKFRKNVKRMTRRGADMEALKTIVRLLQRDASLPSRNPNHPFTGNQKGFRKCHIAPDGLLVYCVQNNVLVLTLTQTGTHGDRFGK